MFPGVVQGNTAPGEKEQAGVLSPLARDFFFLLVGM